MASATATGGGDVDLAAVGAVVADRRRCQILLALSDGRALPASRLAHEAGVSAATASSHLGKLSAAGLLAVEARGRHRYYRIAGPEVADLIEALQRLAPVAPVRSLRQGTRAAALREARTCYDHVAGRLGVGIMRALLDKGHLVGGDGTYRPEVDGSDVRAGYGHDVDYALSPSGGEFLAELGVRVPPRRPLVRYCVDWSEQRHHLSGGIGRGLLDRLLELDWIRRRDTSRAVRITDTGHEGLRATFGVDMS
jgi:DNA-binding transcriptional ArsR family regulator